MSETEVTPPPTDKWAAFRSSTPFANQTLLEQSTIMCLYATLTNEHGLVLAATVLAPHFGSHRITPTYTRYGRVIGLREFRNASMLIENSHSGIHQGKMLPGEVHQVLPMAEALKAIDALEREEVAKARSSAKWQFVPMSSASALLDDDSFGEADTEPSDIDKSIAAALLVGRGVVESEDEGYVLLETAARAKQTITVPPGDSPKKVGGTLVLLWTE